MSIQPSYNISLFSTEANHFVQDVTIPQDYTKRLQLFEEFPYMAVVYIRNLMNGIPIATKRIPGGWELTVGNMFRFDVRSGSRDLTRIAHLTSRIFKNARQKFLRKNPGANGKAFPCPHPTVNGGGRVPRKPNLQELEGEFEFLSAYKDQNFGRRIGLLKKRNI